MTTTDERPTSATEDSTTVTSQELLGQLVEPAACWRCGRTTRVALLLTDRTRVDLAPVCVGSSAATCTDQP